MVRIAPVATIQPKIRIGAKMTSATVVCSECGCAEYNASCWLCAELTGCVDYIGIDEHDDSDLFED